LRLVAVLIMGGGGAEAVLPNLVGDAVRCRYMTVPAMARNPAIAM
jgi:hypothetical protein